MNARRNHHDAALKDEAKTTSDLEEWHKDLNFAIDKYPKETLWYLLMHLKDQFGRFPSLPIAMDRSTVPQWEQLSGNISPNRVIQLENPSQSKRLTKQKEPRAEKLRKPLTDFLVSGAIQLTEEQINDSMKRVNC